MPSKLPKKTESEVAQSAFVMRNVIKIVFFLLFIGIKMAFCKPAMFIGDLKNEFLDNHGDEIEGMASTMGDTTVTVFSWVWYVIAAIIILIIGTLICICCLPAALCTTLCCCCILDD